MDGGDEGVRAALAGALAMLAAGALVAACEAADPAPIAPEPTPVSSVLPVATEPTAVPAAPPPPPPTPTPLASPTAIPVIPPTATILPTPAPQATPAPAPSGLGPEIEAIALIGTCEFFLEVADSQREQEIGLMGRESMKLEHGMMFVFEEEQTLTFWMKNTLIPLDIVFIDSHLAVVDVQTMRPEHEIAPAPLPIYTSAGPALYAVEINEGLAEACGVARGDSIQVRRLTEDVQG